MTPSTQQTSKALTAQIHSIKVWCAANDNEERVRLLSRAFDEGRHDK